MAADPGLVTLMLDAQLPQIADSMHRSLDAILSAAFRAQNSNHPSTHVAPSQPLFCCIPITVETGLDLPTQTVCTQVSHHQFITVDHSNQDWLCHHYTTLVSPTSFPSLCCQTHQQHRLLVILYQHLHCLSLLGCCCCLSLSVFVCDALPCLQHIPSSCLCCRP